MRQLLLVIFIILLLPTTTTGKNRIISQQVKSLQVMTNQDWLDFPTVMRLGSDDVISISFDELSHTYHRYTYQVEHCEADWTPSEEIFESDWLEGFNNNPIDDYENSVNTIVPYTHYQFHIPNENCRLKISGNYRIHIMDEETTVAIIEFMVTEQTMSTSLSVTTNTDIDTNISHQQIAMSLSYGSLTVNNPEEQIRTVVLQNGREDNKRNNIRPNHVNIDGLEWVHNRELIFDAGNEYRKFEVLDVSHPTMGIDRIYWDGEYYQAFPFMDEPRPHYIYDEDANGAFYLRNSDNWESETTSEYVWVNYRLKCPILPEGRIVIDGNWTTDDNIYNYVMHYDEEAGTYTARILQKQGYYSYQYLWQKDDDRLLLLPSEGNFYQTENSYQAFVYYRGPGERTWRLVSYCQRKDSGV